EIITADQICGDALSLITVAHVHLHTATRNHTRKNLVTVAQVLIHRIRKGRYRGRLCRVVSAYHGELIGITHRQPLQQHAVRERKNRGVGADAQGQTRDHYQRETGVLAQHAQGVPDVLPNHIHRRFPPLRSYRSHWSYRSFFTRTSEPTTDRFW